MEKKEKLLLLFILGIVIVLLTNVDLNIQNNDGNTDIKLSDDRVPGSPIFIDDADPNFNWSKTAKENNWCSGSGTWNDPYVIRDLIITCSVHTSCIEIRNSNVPFIIQNCDLSDTQNLYGGGIKLENVNNCKIMENEIHSFTGDEVAAIGSWVSSNNNTIFRNVIYDTINCIYFIEGEKNNFSENKMTNSLRLSLQLRGGKNNYIINNNLTGMSDSTTTGAIEVYRNTETTVRGNIVTAGLCSGIILHNSQRKMEGMEYI